MSVLTLDKQVKRLDVSTLTMRRGIVQRVLNQRVQRDLTLEQNERVREVYKRLLANGVWKNDTKAAEELQGMDRSGLSRFRRGLQGTSVQTAQQILRKAGEDSLGLLDEPDAISQLRLDERTKGWPAAVWEGLSSFERASTEPNTAEELLFIGQAMAVSTRGKTRPAAPVVASSESLRQQRKAEKATRKGKP